jgi:hypothetical protein
LGETASDETETVETWLNDTKPAGITEELAESPPIEEEELPEWLEDLESQREVEEEEEEETGLVDEDLPMMRNKLKSLIRCLKLRD